MDDVRGGLAGSRRSQHFLKPSGLIAAGNPSYLYAELLLELFPLGFEILGVVTGRFIAVYPFIFFLVSPQQNSVLVSLLHNDLLRKIREKVAARRLSSAARSGSSLSGLRRLARCKERQGHKQTQSNDKILLDVFHK